jgi:hypothetical protein
VEVAVADDEVLILDYTARDFDAIRSMLVGIARGKFPEWRTIGEANDFGTLLLELYAYMGDVAHFYVDRVSSEAFLGTALRRQSVLYMAEMLGYVPMGQLAAVCELKFKLDSNYILPENATELVIPGGTRIETTSTNDDIAPISFETDYSVSIVPGGTATVSATEGRTVRDILLGVSKGTPNGSFSLGQTGVISGSVEISSLEGGSVATSPQYVKWFETPAVVTGRPTQSVFSTWTNEEGTAYVLFGDNASGRIPPVGVEIRATYRYGVGAAANSLPTNSLTVITDQTLPIEALTVTNEGPPFGGTNAESIESMRFSIPRANRVRERAVTLDDFVFLTLQVPGIAKAMAYGEIYSSVNIKVAPVTGEVSPTVMAQLKRDVIDYLEDKILVGSKVFVEDFLWKPAYVSIDVHVLDGFSQDEIKASVISTVTEAFKFESLDFGQQVTVGQVYRAVMQLRGIDWIDITAMNFAGPSATTVVNLVPARDEIVRIHPGTAPFDVDPSGLKVTMYGGTS